MAAILQKLRGIDVRRLSGGSQPEAPPLLGTPLQPAAAAAVTAGTGGVKKTDQAAVEAARARFAARKAARKK